jgi:hypothetical protein
LNVNLTIKAFVFPVLCGMRWCLCGMQANAARRAHQVELDAERTAAQLQSAAELQADVTRKRAEHQAAEMPVKSPRSDLSSPPWFLKVNAPDDAHFSDLPSLSLFSREETSRTFSICPLESL